MQTGRLAWIAMAWLAGCGSSSSLGHAPPELTRSEPEPAGANCAYGGTATSTGIDGNANDVLDDSEVIATTYECNPATTSLVRTDVLTANLTCPGGGAQMFSGIDDNNDGVLQDAEIDSSSVQCNSLEHWTGDFTAADWNDPVKVAALHGARIVDGTLTIAAGGVITLPLLESVHGDLVAHGDVAELRLEALREVDGDITLDAGQLHFVTFPMLARIGGDFTVLRTSDLGASITAPLLQTVGGGLSFARAAAGVVAFPQLATVGALSANGTLSACNLDGLTSVAGDLTFGDRGLAHLALPALATIGGALVLQGATQLTTIELPALQQVGQDLKLDSLLFVTSLALPSLREVGGQLSLHEVDQLSTIDLGILEDVHGGVRIDTARALSALALPKLSVIDGDPIGTGLAVVLTGLHELEFPVLRTITGGIAISDNAQLHDLQFPALSSAGSWSVSAAPVLDRVTAPSLPSIDRLSITSSPALHTLDLPVLTQAHGGVTLLECGLSDLSGLRALASALSVHLGATQLHDLRGLSSLQDLRVLALDGNAALTSLDGLELLSTHVVTVTISNNAVLASLAGLHNVTSLSSLAITGNAALPAIALTSLTSVASDLTIADNRALSSLSGLDALISVGGALRVTGNDALAPAELAAFLARFGR